MLNATEDRTMLDATQKKYGLKGTEYAGINYQYFDERARTLRSEAVWKLLKSGFSDKKFSSESFIDQADSMLDRVRCKFRPCPQS